MVFQMKILTGFIKQKAKIAGNGSQKNKIKQ